MCCEDNDEMEKEEKHYKDRLKLIEDLLEETNYEIYLLCSDDASNEPSNRLEKLRKLYYKKGFLERLYAVMQAAREKNL
ncbi:hypothetical protein L7H89_004091 [Klebsiella pneumoniae]|nr:hypothetical protein [Klebsiella pneumoniae]